MWTTDKEVLVYRDSRKCRIELATKGKSELCWHATVEPFSQDFQYLDDAKYWVEQTVHDLERFRTGRLDLEMPMDGEEEKAPQTMTEDMRQLILKGL